MGADPWHVRQKSLILHTNKGARESGVNNGKILLEKIADVSVMTLNDPSVLNAFGHKLREDMQAAMDRPIYSCYAYPNELRADLAAYMAVDEDGPLLDRVETVEKISVGYIRDFHPAEHLKLGIGGLVSRYDYPSALDRAYGDPTS